MSFERQVPDERPDAYVVVVGSGETAERLAHVLATVVPGARTPGVPVDGVPTDADGVIAVGATSVDSTLRRCLEIGTPALCDPAYAATPTYADEVAALVDLEADHARRVVSVGFTRRHDPRFRALRGQVADGGIGEARLVHARLEVDDPVPDLLAALPVELDTWAWLAGIAPTAVRVDPVGDGLLVTAHEPGGGVLDLELGHGAGEVRWEVVGTQGTAELTTTRAWLAEAERILLTAWVRSVATGAPVDGVGAGLAEALHLARVAAATTG